MTSEFTIQIIKNSIPITQLQAIAMQGYGDMVKAVVDLEKGIMAIGGEMHADEEAVMLEQGSKQENLWGCNLYPERTGEAFIELDSMINIRPRQGNRSRSVESEDVREKIRQIIGRLVS